MDNIKLCQGESPRPRWLSNDFLPTLSRMKYNRDFGIFQSNLNFEKCFNATFITLIPKQFGASDLKDYRQISLVGGVYKTWLSYFLKS